ncbi:MAG TPA: peptide chain release factor 1 [Oscillospiraceae bacterium]|nr:peptide chain release factor 1 [Oscillospiraceae bacterium]HQQ89066.1 peptide chain release factor 1 [Oscillospiraceae bacterium]HRW56207.1 peptide chain release factor 1 [Oscillospiraceae bacterium]
MFNKLAEIEKRYDEIDSRLGVPEVVNDVPLYTQLLKEYRSLTPLVETYRKYLRAQEACEEAKGLLAEESDPELREMAQEQWNENRETAERTAEELKILLLPKDPDDDRSVIMEIRGGAGGEEAALFAADLYRMYAMYAAAKGWTCEILDANETELGGFKEIQFSLEGEGVFAKLKYESGVHRVQRVPETETQGRIQTSTVTVAVLPEVEDVEIEIDPKDLQIDTFRSSGAGGQKVNKTSSAIRVTYLPLNMVVECQDERSQYKNKDRALKILRSRLYEKKRQERDDEIAAERRSQVGTGMRNERIRTYNFPQGRVTDHRIGLTLYRIDAIMNGDLDELLDAVRAYDMAEKLRAGASEG